METRRKRIDFRELSDIKLPPRKKKPPKITSQTLFPVEIVDKEPTTCRVKVHYIGYGVKYDEWRDESEVEVLDEREPETTSASNRSPIEHYCLFKDLGFKIKRALSCSRKTSPHAKIVMSFDILLFNGGLLPMAVPSRKAGGIQRYTIRNYSDLNSLLGCNWHFRGLNSNGDYGYVILKSVEFYIRKGRRILEYIPCQPTASGDGTSGSLTQSISTGTGYTLTFTFIVGYGTPATFGKDKTVFYNSV